MRWIVALVALGAAAWFLRDGQRRARVQDTLRNAMPAGRAAPDDDTGATPSDMTATARATVAEVQARWPQTASRVADLTARAGRAVVQTAQAVATATRQRSGDAASWTVAAAGMVMDRAQQARQAATGQAHETGADNPPSVATEEAGLPPPALHDTMPAAGADKDNDDTLTSMATAATPGSGTSETGHTEPLLGGRTPAVIGNRNTRVFHVATARNLPAEDNRVYFATAEEALAADFSPVEGEGLDDAGAP